MTDDEAFRRARRGGLRTAGGCGPRKAVKKSINKGIPMPIIRGQSRGPGEKREKREKRSN